MTLAVFGFYLWECGSAFTLGRGESTSLVVRFHSELNNSEYDEILREADDSLAGQGGQFLQILDAVHKKLGNEESSEFDKMNVEAETNGTFVTAEYSTYFERGRAIESFTWLKRGSTLRLFQYSIQIDGLSTQP